jgi:hypothetical protein
LKGRFARNCNDACAPACAPAPCGGPAHHPEVIPAPKTKELDKGKGGITGIQIEPIVTPVVAPRQPLGPSINPF